MKKLIITCLFMSAFAFVSFAQNNPPKTKEQKAAEKAKKEADLVAAFTELGLPADQQTLVRMTLTDAEQKGKDIKNDDALTEAEKAAKKDEVNSAKNEKLKQIMGAEKFKQWSAIRKKQKEATQPPPPPAPNK
ncbi:hypothetical protein LK994_10770 [Ferruginibacter lapsinanis]|uniref:hypothetical protein n=1 Tax=Ferruginibacter lapsinanis TaxID=563172 RepID=UPI001E60B48D|nr:hypothetical protein [Ferruginibacter lapsinanis]UEG49113.1 hypothetical protein LK994_10770 [Ferruginibacter lapsinanis]